jgi:CRP-like cAMP-binding protein
VADVDPTSTARVAREVFVATFLRDLHGVAWATQRLASRMRDVEVAAGQTIFALGEPAIHQYFIVRGEVVVSAPGAPPWTFHERGIVGGLDVVLDRARTRSAVATTPTHLLELSGADFFSLLADSFDVARRAVQGFAVGVSSLRARPQPLGGFDEPDGDVSEGRARLDLVDRMLLLRGAPLLQGAGAQAIATLAEAAEERVLRPGEVLFERGKQRQLHFVAAGQVEATRSSPDIVGHFRRGAIVCDAEAFGDASPFEARATHPSCVVSVSLEDYFDVMEEKFDVARAALRAFTLGREKLLDRQ